MTGFHLGKVGQDFCVTETVLKTEYLTLEGPGDLSSVFQVDGFREQLLNEKHWRLGVYGCLNCASHPLAGMYSLEGQLFPWEHRRCASAAQEKHMQSLTTPTFIWVSFQGYFDLTAYIHLSKGSIHFLLIHMAAHYFVHFT